MDYQWTILKADGTSEAKVTKTEPTLKDYQDAVGGYIQVVRTFGGKLMILDEEGKLKGKEINKLASELYASPVDVIVGDVVICENFEPS